MSLYNLIRYIKISKKVDIIYGVTFRGLEFVIFLRALGLIKTPIVVWHHSGVTTPKNPIRKKLSSLFYKGFDKLLFFSDKLRNDSLTTGKVKEENAIVIHWGADLCFYDAVLKNRNTGNYFISTGKENRDFPTLIKAFNQMAYECDIYTYKKAGDKDYETILANSGITLHPNVKIHLGYTNIKELAEYVNNSCAVMICCLDYPYTVGLTTIVEALALGLPIVTTDNPNFPIDVEKEGVGLKVGYGDVEGWIKAVEYIKSHPQEAQEMGRRGRLLAEKTYNLDNYSKELANILLNINL